MTTTIGEEISRQAARYVDWLPARVLVVRALDRLRVGDVLTLERSSFPGWICSRADVVAMGHMVAWFIARGFFQPIP